MKINESLKAHSQNMDESISSGILRIVKVLARKLLVLSSKRGVRQYKNKKTIPDPALVAVVLSKHSRVVSPQFQKKVESNNIINQTIRAVTNAVETIGNTITLSAISLIGFDLYAMIKTGKSYPDQLANDLKQITMPAWMARIFGGKSTQKGHVWTVRGIAREISKVPTIGWIIALFFSVLLTFIAKKFRNFALSSTYTHEQLKQRTLANELFYHRNGKVYPKKRVGPTFIRDTKHNITFMLTDKGVWYPNQPNYLLKKVDGLRVRRLKIDIEPIGSEGD